MSDTIRIDGSLGEGGGQVLRTSLALSIVTGRPLRIEKIRANRRPPGLKRQHLAAVRAAQRVGCAEVMGAELGARTLELRPGEVATGRHEIAIGSAGSATLVLQTVFPALLLAPAETTLVVEGGTHNPLAPTFDFLEKAWAPLMRRLGADLDLVLERPGFYPRGGGVLRATVRPARLGRLDVLERGEVTDTRVVARVAGLPRSIAEREADTLARALDLRPSAARVEELDDAFGPGNVVLAELASPRVTEVFAGLGEKGVRAEEVARRVAREVKDHLATGAPVGPHLADQLLLPLALGEGGSFLTGELSGHATTQIDVIRAFLPEVTIETRREEERGRGRDVWRVEVSGRGVRGGNPAASSGV